MIGPGKETCFMEARPVLWIVVPCYNEEQVLPMTAPMFLKKILQLEEDGRISKAAGSSLSTTGQRIKPGRSSGTWPRRTRSIPVSARAGTAGTRTPCWPG